MCFLVKLPAFYVAGRFVSIFFSLSEYWIAATFEDIHRGRFISIFSRFFLHENLHSSLFSQYIIIPSSNDKMKISSFFGTLCTGYLRDFFLKKVQKHYFRAIFLRFNVHQKSWMMRQICSPSLAMSDQCFRIKVALSGLACTSRAQKCHSACSKGNKKYILGTLRGPLLSPVCITSVLIEWDYLL